MADDGKQNQTEYAPTTAARKLLEVRLDPANRLKSISEQCRMADISRDSWYRLMEDDAYIEWEKGEAVKRLGRFAAPLLMTYVNEGLRGSKQHADVLLDMLGIYTQRTRTELTGRDGAPLGGILPKDQVEQQLREMGLLPAAPEAEQDKPH